MRAVLGATLAVVGVLLAIGGVLLLSDPQSGAGPVVAAAVSASGAPPAAVLPPATVARPAATSAAPAATAFDAGTPRAASEPAPRASAQPSPLPPSPAAGPALLPVTVLNNSRIAGLAEQAAVRLRNGGWPVARTGSFRGRIPSTTAYYDSPASRTAARALAQRFPGIVRVRPRFATLPARGLVVVVTRDWRR